MTFIKCAECENIIAIKDLKLTFSSELLNEATEENTVRGSDLCAACAARYEAERKAAELAQGNDIVDTAEEEHHAEG